MLYLSSRHHTQYGVWIAHPCTPVHILDSAIHLTSDGEGHLPVQALSLLNLTPQSWLHCHREGRKARLGAAHGQCYQVCVVPCTKSGASLKYTTLQLNWSLVCSASNKCTEIFWLTLKCMESQGVLGSSILYLIERLSSLWRLKCTSVIEKRPQSVSFKERFFYCVRGSSVVAIKACPRLGQIRCRINSRTFLHTLLIQYCNTVCRDTKCSTYTATVYEPEICQ